MPLLLAGEMAEMGLEDHVLYSVHDAMAWHDWSSSCYIKLVPI